MNESDPSATDIDALLGAMPPPAPPDAFRERVLVAMEHAAVERRAIVAAHRRAEAGRGTAPRRPIRAESLAGAAAALTVLVAGWRQSPAPHAAEAPVAERRQESEAGVGEVDVERALALLDARRSRLLACGVSPGTGVDTGGSGRLPPAPPRL